jgi:hypothetical protein
MFVKHIIKTLHVSVTIVWPSSVDRLSCLVLLLPSVFVCVVKLFIWYVVVMLSMCVRAWYTDLWDVWLWGSQPSIPQSSTSGTHTHRQHTATYQINNLITQTSREGSNSTKHERRSTEDGQTIVTKTCRVLNDVFYKHF